MLLILYATGWKQQVADGVSGRALAIFVIAVLILHNIKIPIGTTTDYVQGSVLAAVGAAILSLVSIRQAGQFVYLTLCSLFTGVIWMWVHVMYRADPVFVGIHPLWDGPLIAGLMAGILVERFRHQFTLIVASALISQLVDIIRPPGGMLIIGSLGWWDGFAIALLSARIVSLVRGFIRSLLQKGNSRFTQRGGNS